MLNERVLENNYKLKMNISEGAIKHWHFLCKQHWCLAPLCNMSNFVYVLPTALPFAVICNFVTATFRDVVSLLCAASLLLFSYLRWCVICVNAAYFIAAEQLCASKWYAATGLTRRWQKLAAICIVVLYASFSRLKTVC